MTLPLLLSLLALVPLACVPLSRALGRRAGWPVGLLLLVALAVVLPRAEQVLAGRPVEWSHPWVESLGVSLAFRLDGLGLVFLVLALGVGAIVFFYSASYLPDRDNTGFYVVMTAFTFAMVALVMADDLVVLFLCWELTSLASFLLIARAGHGGEGGSMRTLLITFTGGLTLLVAVAVIIERTGTTSLTEALASPVWQEQPAIAALVGALVAISGMTKAAQFPFHLWLPDAMAAATPVSAYLHAAAVVKAGIFLLLRFSPAFHDVLTWQILLIVVGLFTTCLGGLFALQQADLKKLMAYSTVSQLGLIVATIGIGTPAALAVAVLHTIAHALFKSGLFMMVGVIDHQTGTRLMTRLPALRSVLPWSFGAVILGTASMAGIPPMLGFVSKEGIFTAMLEAPGPAWAGGLALAAAAVGAVLTFCYCGRIITGAFIDGPDPDPKEKDIREDWWLLVPAALSLVAGLPLALLVGAFDRPVNAALRAVHPTPGEGAHFALWHGLTLELALTLLVFVVGTVLVLRRTHARKRLEHGMLPFDGVSLLEGSIRVTQRAGARLAELARTEAPARHLTPPLVMLGGFLLIGSAGLWRVGAVEPYVARLTRPIDILVLMLTTAAVAALVRAKTRIGGAVLLGGVGVAMTMQIFMLGAPDVGLTLLLVEVLTVIVIMLVLRKLPAEFANWRRTRYRSAVSIALLSGVAAGVAAWTMLGRRQRSPVAEWYLANASEISGGANIVNVILVEFRALDTFGELAVLGMAGVAILAVLATIPPKLLDPKPDPEDESSPVAYVPPPKVALGPRGTRSHRALEDVEANTEPLRLLQRALVPVLAVVSAVLLWRGHNSPGGGFIAALVAACAVSYIYLAKPADLPVSRPRVPVLLVAGGVLVAIVTGLAGYLPGQFLEPIYGEILGVKVASSLIFDLGVYAAVLGLVMVAFNSLGTRDPYQGLVRPTSEEPEMARERMTEPSTEVSPVATPADGAGSSAEPATSASSTGEDTP